MKLNPQDWKKWQIVLLIFAVYNLIVLINIPSVYFSSLQRPEARELFPAFARMALFHNLWALITPLILWLGWMFPVAKPNFRRNLFLHSLFALGSGVLQHAASSVGTWMLGISSAADYQTSLFNAGLLMRVVTGTLVHYPVIIISQSAYLYFKESKERAFLQKQAELSALQAQLQPHFFFNTLNALSALIYRSPKEADLMITRLGDLFRMLLKKDKEPEITLAEELELSQAYLKIHQTLMGDRLKVEWNIAPETLGSKVPNLILQPIIENSVRHGLSPLEEGGTLQIDAVRQNGNLLLAVNDDGVGADAEENVLEGGIGISNTRKRLQHLYGNEHLFEMKHNPKGGLNVMIRIPFNVK